MRDGLKNLGRASEIGKEKPLTFELDGEAGVLFYVDGKWFAVRNRCPHQQFEKLHEGEVEGTVLTCPMHGWKFDLTSGNSVNAGGTLRVWNVLEKDGEIFVANDKERK
jgi:nitrite reductase (NADH) small subunit